MECSCYLRNIQDLLGRVEQAWRMRWSAILSRAAARAALLLELRGPGGADGAAHPSHEVGVCFCVRLRLSVDRPPPNCSSPQWIAPPPDHPQFHAVFPSPAQNFVLFSLLWGLVVELWWIFCPLRALGALRAIWRNPSGPTKPGRQGSTIPSSVCLRLWRFKNKRHRSHENSTRRPGEEHNGTSGRRRKNNANFVAPAFKPNLCAPPLLGPHFFQVWDSPAFGPLPFRSPSSSLPHTPWHFSSLPLLSQKN